MKNVHEIGKAFRCSIGSKSVVLVALECESTFYPKTGELVRNTCIGCYFNRRQLGGYCSGRPYFDSVCDLGEPRLCNASERPDGKNIHYKLVKRV